MQIKEQLIAMQINEITEYEIYSRIAFQVKDKKNKAVLERIALEEKTHAQIWREFTDYDAKPKLFKVFFYVFLSKILGYTFVLKRMESSEKGASIDYNQIAKEVPQAKKIAEDEDRHEKELLALLDEELLQYAGSMVLGLNDALVEISGTLAGLTFALKNNKLVALSALITGIAATLSMASSEYLSSRSEGRTDALKSCAYTGIVYLITVTLLVLPYLLFPAAVYMPPLFIMIATCVLIIFLFTYYLSVAKDLPFWNRFAEMAGISLTVAVLSFFIGLLVKILLGVDA